MTIRRAVQEDREQWLRMRNCLWPEAPQDNEFDIDSYFATNRGVMATFVAEQNDQSLCGFLEAATRPFADGCSSSPVGYLEGWWVDVDIRGTGIGRKLVVAAESWARSLGLSEMASDAEINNIQSHAAHEALGYEEVQRNVCFRKVL